MDTCKDWTQLKVTVPLEQLDALVAVMRPCLRLETQTL